MEKSNEQLSKSETKTCFNCAYSYGHKGEFRRCNLGGYYCDVVRSSGRVCDKSYSGWAPMPNKELKQEWPYFHLSIICTFSFILSLLYSIAHLKNNNYYLFLGNAAMCGLSLFYLIKSVFNYLTK